MRAQFRLEFSIIFHSRLNLMLLLLLLGLFLMPLVPIPQKTSREYHAYFEEKIQQSDELQGQVHDEKFLSDYRQSLHEGEVAFQKDDVEAQAQVLYRFQRLVVKATKAGQSVDGESLLRQKAKLVVIKEIVAKRTPYLGATGRQAPAVNYFANIFQSELAALLIFVIMIAFLSGMFSNYENERTREFDSLVPLSAYPQILAKLCAYYITAIGGLLLAGGIVFLVMGMRNGFGYNRFPVVGSMDGQTVLLRSTGIYLARYLSILSLTILALVLMVYLIAGIVWGGRSILLLAIAGLLFCFFGKNIFGINVPFFLSGYLDPNVMIVGDLSGAPSIYNQFSVARKTLVIFINILEFAVVGILIRRIRKIVRK